MLRSDEEEVQPVAEDRSDRDDSRGVDDEEFPLEELVEEDQVRDTDACTPDDDRDDRPDAVLVFTILAGMKQTGTTRASG